MLKSEKPSTTTRTTKNDVGEDELVDLFDKKLDLSCDFPFLNHGETINFVKKSKVSSYEPKKLMKKKS